MRCSGAYARTFKGRNLKWENDANSMSSQKAEQKNWKAWGHGAGQDVVDLSVLTNKNLHGEVLSWVSTKPSYLHIMKPCSTFRDFLTHHMLGTSNHYPHP